MKQPGKFVRCLIFALALCAAWMAMPASRGEAADAKFVSSEKGGHNGDLTDGAGTPTAKAEVFVFADAYDTFGAYDVRVNVEGSGFNPNAFITANVTSGNWEIDSSFSPIADNSGKFGPTTLVLKRQATGVLRKR